MFNATEKSYLETNAKYKQKSMSYINVYKWRITLAKYNYLKMWLPITTSLIHIMITTQAKPNFTRVWSQTC